MTLVFGGGEVGACKKKKEIYHHGIKGQRWGIRRFQNKDGTLTEAGKRKYGGHEDDDVYLKDYQFAHVTSIKNLKLRKKPTYLSPANENNVDTYFGPYAGYLKAKGAKDVYADIFNAKRAIVVPSKKKTMQEFDKILKNNPKYTDIAMRGIYDLAKQRKMIKNDSPWTEFKKDRERMYSLFASSYLDYYFLGRKYSQEQYIVGQTLAKGFVNSLSRQKYNAIYDSNDNEKYYAAEKSLIVFNGKKYLEQNNELFNKRLPDFAIWDRIQKLKAAGYTSNTDVKHSGIMN